MSLETALKTGISIAAVGDRIGRGRLPQDPTLPAITYTRISTKRTYDHSGDTGKERVRIQFTCWATTDSQAGTIAEALVSQFSGYSGTFGGLSIDVAFIADERSDYDPERKYESRIVDVFFKI